MGWYLSAWNRLQTLCNVYWVSGWRMDGWMDRINTFNLFQIISVFSLLNLHFHIYGMVYYDIYLLSFLNVHFFIYDILQ